MTASTNPHDRMVTQAASLFNAQRSATHNRDAYRDKLFAALREANAGKPDVEKWKLACEILTGAKLRSHEMDLPDNNWREHYRKQLEDWLQHFLDHDLADMLRKLHAAGLAAEYTSTDPASWADSQIPF